MVALVNSLLLSYHLTDFYEIWHVDVKMNGEYDYVLCNALPVVGRGAGGLPAPKLVITDFQRGKIYRGSLL